MVEMLLLLMMTAGTGTPGCTGVDSEALLWGAVGAGIVEMGPVPPGRAWLIRAAGGFTDDGSPAEFMMEIVRPVLSQGGVCCWRIPVARNVGLVNGTPTITLPRSLVLHAGEKLSVRRNPNPTGKIGITAVYYDLPRSCLPVTP